MASVSNHPTRLLTIKAGDWAKVKAHTLLTTANMKAAAAEIRQLRADLQRAETERDLLRSRLDILHDRMRASIKVVEPVDHELET